MDKITYNNLWFAMLMLHSNGYITDRQKDVIGESINSEPRDFEPEEWDPTKLPPPPHGFITQPLPVEQSKEEVCSVCCGIGEVTAITGQTPETYDAENVPCPKCQKEPKEGDVIELLEDWDTKSEGVVIKKSNYVIKMVYGRIDGCTLFIEPTYPSVGLIRIKKVINSGVKHRIIKQ